MAGLILVMVLFISAVRPTHEQRSLLDTRALAPRDTSASWDELFTNRRRVKKLMVQKVADGPASDLVGEVLKRRIEEEGKDYTYVFGLVLRLSYRSFALKAQDHHALSVALKEVKPCSGAASEAGILLWECSINTYSGFQSYSPSVAFALVIEDPLEYAVSRFYQAHETEAMRRHVPIAKYFRGCARFLW